jgi:hypothetical protein
MIFWNGDESIDQRSVVSFESMTFVDRVLVSESRFALRPLQL